MGAEMVVALGARAGVGRILDTERAVARAYRAFASAWLF